jgi:hypothetical protein
MTLGVLVIVCWSMRGGAGVTVVAAVAALVAAKTGAGSVVLVDLDGDLPTVLGVPEPDGPGLGEWSRAPSDVPIDALARLEVPVTPGLALLPRGEAGLAPERADLLVALLAADPRLVVVDAGRVRAEPARAAVIKAASRSLLVTAACPPAMRRLHGVDPAPSGVVIVHRHACTAAWQEVAAAAGSPVVASLDHDPTLARLADLGLARQPLPRRVARAVRGLW